MTQIEFKDLDCQRFWAKLDSYIDNELVTETNIECTEHLERCPACMIEAEARQKVRLRLKTAVREVPVPPELEGRIRERLRRAKQPHPQRPYLMAIAAALAVCIGVFRSGGSFPPLLALGFDDHVHCAVQHRPAAKGGPVDQLPGEFKQLLPVIRGRMPAKLPLLLAHECRDGQRDFIHLTFDDGRNLLSVVITRRQTGESLGDEIRGASHDGFQLAAFQTRNYFVYSVSDLNSTDNLAALDRIAPTLRGFLDQMTA